MIALDEKKDSVRNVAVCSRSFSKNPVLRDALSSKFKHVKFNDEGHSLAGDSLISFLHEADLAITALEIINDYVLSNLPRLKRISKYGVGLDMIDMNSMRRHGKQLAWKGGVNRRAVAELALTMILSIIRKVPASQSQIMSGKWTQTVGNTLSGKTVGIIGCGSVGQDLAQLLKPFKCRIIINDIQDRSEFCNENDLRVASIDELLVASDVVTLHVPLDASTRHILSHAELSLMKRGSILINTARGGLVDESALLSKIKEKKIFGAGLDVFESEPPFGSELLQLPEVFPTSHIGGSAEEAIIAMGKAAIDGLSISDDNIYFK